MLDYLDALDISPDEHLSVMWKQNGSVSTAVLPLAAIPAILAYQIPSGSDIYLSPNPTSGPMRMGPRTGRGTEDQVTRVAALYADLDIKPGACPDVDTAQLIIDDLSGLLGERPVATIFSGGGLQPLWALDDCAPGPGRVLLRRFGRLVRAVADTRNVKVDSVFDTARVLRVPGTTNYKYSPPVAAQVIPGIGAPMDPATVAERLDEAGINEIPEDTGLGSEIIADPAGFQWSSGSCGYMKRTVASWAFDQPMARHPWLLSQFVRLEAAHRNSCLTKDDYDQAVSLLTQKFDLLCARGGDTRKVKPYEVRDIRIEARSRVARKTDAQIMTELGAHPHLETGAELARPVSAVLGPSASPVNGSAARSAPGITSLASANGRLQVVTMDRIATVTPTWAWHYNGGGRIQLGTVCLLAGRPGAGKSTAARWFAAGYTRGAIPGVFAGSPVNVAYFSPAEESWASVIKPGLIASGADMARVITFNPVDEQGNPTKLVSSTYESDIVEVCNANNIRVLIVDPLMSTIPGQANINQNNETRQYLEPWARIATATDAIVIGVAHLTKHPGADLVAAINGSSAFGEVARSIFMFVKDTESSEGDRIMTQAKNSTGPEDLSLIYRVQTVIAPMDDSAGAEVTTFVIQGISDISAADAMEAATEGGAGFGAVDDARVWLADYLTTMGRCRPKEVIKAAKDEGHTERTVYRAARKLKVDKVKEGFPAQTYWRMVPVASESWLPPENEPPGGED